MSNPKNFNPSHRDYEEELELDNDDPFKEVSEEELLDNSSLLSENVEDFSDLCGRQIENLIPDELD
jgi:hypothetical protein